MRRLAGSLLLISATLLPGRAHAADAKKPAATPTPTPGPDAAADDELPTIAEDATVAPPARHDDEWDNRSRGNGVILGLRIGVHAFEPAGIAGDGGLAFEAVAAMPVRGPFYAAAVAGYHTGYRKAGGDDRRRFFDAEFGAIEGQYRHNAGRINLMTGLGVGFLSGNTAEVTLADGSPGSASGGGPLAHVVGGAEYQLGRIGLAGELRYGFSPVDFKEAHQTIGMGGVTLAIGFDLGF